MLLNKNNFLRWDGDFVVSESINISFADQTGLTRSTLIISNSLTISGLTAPRSISIVGGEFQINGGIFSSVPSTIQNGDILRVRVLSSDLYNKESSSTITIGANSGTFKTFTKIAPMVPLRMQLTFGTSFSTVIRSRLIIDINGVLNTVLWDPGVKEILIPAGSQVRVYSDSFNASTWPVGAFRLTEVMVGGSLFYSSGRIYSHFVPSEFIFIAEEGNSYVAAVLTAK